MLADYGHVGCDHFFDQFVKAHAMLPTECCTGFGRVTNEKIDFGRSKILRIKLR